MKKKHKKSSPETAASGILPETSPLTQLTEEFAELRAEFHVTLQAYSAGLEASMQKIADTLAALEPADQHDRERSRKLRDMVGVVRKRKLKPAKGRRKDLKSIEDIVDDLNFIRGEPSRPALP